MGRLKGDKAPQNNANRSSEYEFSIDSPTSNIPFTRSGSSENKFIVESRQLGDLLQWFLAGDLLTRVAFSPALSKDDRAKIHVQAQAMKIDTLSEGVGTERHIIIFKPGHMQARTRKDLTEEQRDCSDALYRLTRSQDAYKHLSKDELTEVLFGEGEGGQLRSDLQQIWASAKDEVKLRQALIKTITSSDLEGLILVMEEAKSIASSSLGHRKAADLLGLSGKGTGESPICFCARIGAAEPLRLILREFPGIDLDAKDQWSGRTPLMVSRTFEQCDVEAILLQSGAVDPDAALFPLSSVAAALGLKNDDQNDEDEDSEEI